MSLRSYTVLKRELRQLRAFYDRSLAAYDLAYRAMIVRHDNPGEFDEFFAEKDALLTGSRVHVFGRAAKEGTENMLRELVLIRAISALETFLVDAVRDVFVVNKAPFLDKGSKLTFTQEDLLTNNNPTKIFSRVINRETRQLTSGGFNEAIKYYRKRFDIDLGSIAPGYEVMNEYHDRRHILVHRLGQTDEQYRGKYSTDVKRLRVDPDYLLNMLRDVRAFTVEVARRMGPLAQSGTDFVSPYQGRFIIDVLLLSEHTPRCLRPNFQFWADDEYVVLTDLLVGTYPADEGRVRHYLTGSDRALEKYKRFIEKEQKKLTISVKVVADLTRTSKGRKTPRYISEEQLDQIRAHLPNQPWPKGIHKTVAQELGFSNGLVSAAIDALIARKVFKDQIDGEIIE